ncbi:MAG: HNH endonuclease [Acidobacteria bacterium]|nr:MAG: HNH endonuclease [Acidobacteriota bacterium]
MVEEFRHYFTKIEKLSSDELLRSAQKLVVSENTSIAKLIAHLAEMSSRKTALKLGYNSLYQYCIEGLNLSEGAVPARIHVANVSRRFPQLLVGLAERRISLTVAALLAPHLTEDNVEQVISDCAGKTRKKTEEYLVAIKPKPVFEPSIRKRPATTALDPSPRDTTAPAPAPSMSPSLSSPVLNHPPVETPKSSPSILQPARPAIFNFRFSADMEFKDKFERLAEVMGVENAQKNMAVILEKALDIALEKKDPKKKLERRRKRQSSAKEKSRSNEVTEKDEPAKSRYVASEVSERVHDRDGYQCVYLGLDGRRCTARVGLQLDHRKPFAIFRSNDEADLRILCASHNLLEAERVYGPAFIQQKIAEQRKSRSP